MQNIATKVDGVDVLTGAEFNQIPSELENAILGNGIVLAGGDLFQLGKTIADYSAHGDFYTDSGSATAYVLTKGGIKQSPTAYVDGYRARFFAGNTNTGAVTVNISGLGVKSVVDNAGLALGVGNISSGEVVTLVFDNGNDRFVLLTKANPPTFGNLLINSLGTINQRAVSSGLITGSANQYFLDRWRVPASGDTANFIESVNRVIFTPPASGYEQVIENKNVQSATYTVSWKQETGTTTCKVGVNARTNGESFTLVGGTQTTVNFKGGTYSLPMVQLGAIANPFNARQYGEELSLAKRYYQFLKGDPYYTGQNVNASLVHFTIPLPVCMKSTPSLETGGVNEILVYTHAQIAPSSIALSVLGLQADNSILSLSASNFSGLPVGFTNTVLLQVGTSGLGIKAEL